MLSSCFVLVFSWFPVLFCRLYHHVSRVTVRFLSLSFFHPLLLCTPMFHQLITSCIHLSLLCLFLFFSPCLGNSWTSWFLLVISFIVIGFCRLHFGVWILGLQLGIEARLLFCLCLFLIPYINYILSFYRVILSQRWTFLTECYFFKRLLWG